MIDNTTCWDHLSTAGKHAELTKSSMPWKQLHLRAVCSCHRRRLPGSESLDSKGDPSSRVVPAALLSSDSKETVGLRNRLWEVT